MRKLIIFLSLFVLIGCNNDYSIEESGKNTFVLNQQTGAVSIISDGVLIDLPHFDITKNKILDLNGQFKKTLQFEAKIKQIGSKAYYSLYLEGYEHIVTSSNGTKSKKNKNFSWFLPSLNKHKNDLITLEFLDIDGFKLAEHNIYLKSNYTRIVNNTGEVTGLRYDGSFYIDPIQTLNVKKVGYTYRLDTLKDIQS